MYEQGKAFLIGAGIGAVISFIFGAPVFAFLSFFGVPLVQGLAIFVLIGAFFFGIFALAMSFIWLAIPREVQILTVVLLLVAGIGLVQPELDGFALIGLALTFMNHVEGEPEA